MKVCLALLFADVAAVVSRGDSSKFEQSGQGVREILGGNVVERTPDVVANNPPAEPQEPDVDDIPTPAEPQETTTPQEPATPDVDDIPTPVVEEDAPQEPATQDIQLPQEPFETTETEAVETQETTQEPALDTAKVSCGGHDASICSECFNAALNHEDREVAEQYASYCNGDCLLTVAEKKGDKHTCSAKDPEDGGKFVDCGHHQGLNCGKCANTEHTYFCNGVCEWSNSTHTCNGQ